MIDPIAKCRCGRLFTPGQWAELDTKPVAPGISFSSSYRACPCGLFAARIAPVTLNDIEKAYNEALEEK